MSIPINQQIHWMKKRIGIDANRFKELVQRGRMRPETQELELRNMQAVLSTLEASEKKEQRNEN